MVNASRRSWMRAGAAWEHVPDIYAMTAEQQARHDARIEEINAIKG